MRAGGFEGDIAPFDGFSRTANLSSGGAYPHDSATSHRANGLRRLLHRRCYSVGQSSRRECDNARSGARKRRAESSRATGGGDDVLEPGHRVGAGRLMQPVDQRDREERAVGPQHRREERGSVRQVEDGIGSRDAGGEHRPRLFGGEWLARDQQADAPRTGERDSRRDRPVVAGKRDGERAVERWGHVVGVTFHFAGHAKQGPAVERIAHEGVRRDDAADDGRGARAEAAADRDGRALRHVIGAERLGGRLRCRARRHDEEVVVTARDAVLGAAAVALDIDRPAPRRAQLVFRKKWKGDREGVESRAEIRARRGHAHAELPHCYDLNARRTASGVASTSAIAPASERARSGAFMPLPVRTHTTRRMSRSPPPWARRRSPAIAAADAGSQKTPSQRATKLYASRISPSLTASIAPPDSSRAATAPFHDAGFPTRMAVATVSGSATGLPRTIGAAPSA